MKKPVLYLLLAAVCLLPVPLLLCRSIAEWDASSSMIFTVMTFRGIRRFRIGFASDFHYESRFTRKRLDNAIRAFNL